MSGWTKGPWEAESAGNGRVYGICARDDKGMRLNIVNWGGIARPASDESQANARLIAAAPEMAELLGHLEAASTPTGQYHGALHRLNYEVRALLSRLGAPND